MLEGGDYNFIVTVVTKSSNDSDGGDEIMGQDLVEVYWLMIVMMIIA